MNTEDPEDRLLPQPFSLEQNGMPPLIFIGEQQFLDFASKEHDFWSELTRPVSPQGSNELAATARSKLVSKFTLLKRAEEQLSRGDFQQLQETTNTIQENLNSRELFLSESEVAQIAASLKDSDDVLTSLFFLAGVSGIRFGAFRGNSLSDEFVKGISLASAYNLRNMELDNSQQISQIEAENNSATLLQHTKLAKANQRYRSFRKHYLRLSRIGRKRLKDRMEQFDEELDKKERLFKETFAVTAPTSYWKRKVCRHNLLGGVLISCFVLTAVFAAYRAFTDAPGFNPQELEQLVPHLTKFAIPLLLVVWLLRVVLRVGLQQLALADDASERVVMIQTFRSLMESNDSLSETDRILILQAIFRPAALRSDDDVSPPNWTEILNQLRRKP